MQNSILFDDAMQVRPAGISLEEGMAALKCEIKRLLSTKSETFSWMCQETVTYGEIAKAVVGIMAFFVLMLLVGFLAGGEVM